MKETFGEGRILYLWKKYKNKRILYHSISILSMSIGGYFLFNARRVLFSLFFVTLLFSTFKHKCYLVLLFSQLPASQPIQYSNIDDYYVVTIQMILCLASGKTVQESYFLLLFYYPLIYLTLYSLKTISFIASVPFSICS